MGFLIVMMDLMKWIAFVPMINFNAVTANVVGIVVNFFTASPMLNSKMENTIALKIVMSG